MNWIENRRLLPASLATRCSPLCVRYRNQAAPGRAPPRRVQQGFNCQWQVAKANVTSSVSTMIYGPALLGNCFDATSMNDGVLSSKSTSSRRLQ